MSLDALADVAALSRFHFHRVFRAMTGETLAEAVRRIRMDRAARWLVTEDWPLARVAERAGYPNPRSFARAFGEAFGMTPAAFRKRGLIPHPACAPPKGYPMSYDVRIETAPARHCAGVAHRGPYIEINRAFERLDSIAAARGLDPQITEMLGIYYDDPSAVAPAELRADAGLALAPAAAVPEGLDTVDLPGGKVAVLRFKGHYSGLPGAYDGSTASGCRTRAKSRAMHR